MRKLSFILLVLICDSLFAQQTKKNKITYNPNQFIFEYYDNGQIKTKGEKNKNGLKIGIWNEWYEDGQLKEDANFSEGNLTGKVTKFHKNGQIKSESFHQNDELHGPLVTFFDNGHKKREDQYQNGKFIQGKCYDINGLVVEHFD